ncbi:VWA containing CoxE family protein [Methyloglobulus morosus KoM1]|uniref:VWA containing CoxE family protein n=1 Tax=Methyloglobulus morosus KoM1 TaxID=1116472 RepID=V5DZN7_9GAMM|nr:VWA domain-containing protein [Methyloglobulus morosus]ESS72761.1 VWA containing CoxE family protein [Methyloglobulus morosus KoM1]
MNNCERIKRWRLACGGDEHAARADGLSDRDIRIETALNALYQRDDGAMDGQKQNRKGGLGGSSPRVARWLGDIREFFPSTVVQVIQKDAFTRLGLKQMLMEPEFLSALEADVHLVADLISLGRVIPDKTKHTARQVVAKVVAELMAKLEAKTIQAVLGAVNKAKRTRKPRFADIDWHKTIRANLRHYQQDHNSIVPETLIGYSRKKRQAQLDEVVLCIDQSGSMANSVVYSAIFATVMASIPSLKTQYIAFDTAILDLTEKLSDPVDLLFGVQLGGGTDINQALAYCDQKIAHPGQTHFILISDLCEGGNKEEMLARVQAMIYKGINVIVLLALSDDGKPWHDDNNAHAIAAMGAPVFACTPDQFPDLMAVALLKGDVGEWAAGNKIAIIS